MLGMREENRGWHGRWAPGARRKSARGVPGQDHRPHLPPYPPSASVPTLHETTAETDDARSGSGAAGDGTEGRPDYRLLIARMDEVNEAVLQVPSLIKDPLSLDEQLTFLGDLLVELDRLRESVDRLEAGGSEQGPSAAVAAAAQAEALRADAETGHNRWKAGWTHVWEAVKRMLPQLWALISGLLHVKEWTVTGQLKSDPFGLLQASVTITFGSKNQTA
jgi:hypothetical protein